MSRVSPIRAGDDRVGAVLGIAEHGAAVPVARLGRDRQRRQVRIDLQQGRSFSRVVVDRGRSSSAPPWVVTVVSSSPATTWALVTISPGADRPARALDAEAAGGAEHPHDRAAGAAARRGRSRSPGRARRPAAVGPTIDGAGSTRSSALQDRPRGRQHVVEAAQDQRALDVAAQPRGLRARAGATAPKTQAKPSATEAISAAPPAPSARCSDGAPDQPRPQPRAKPSSVTAISAPTSSAPSAAQSGA